MHGRQKSLIYEWACSPPLSFFFIHTSHFPSLYLFFFFWIDSSLSFLWAGSLFSSFHQTLPISLPFSVRTHQKVSVASTTIYRSQITPRLPVNHEILNRFIMHRSWHFRYCRRLGGTGSGSKQSIHPPPPSTSTNLCVA